MCDEILSYALKSGADQCESVFCAKKVITIRITDSEIAEIKENYEKSVGIRLVQDKKISSAQSTILDATKIVDEARWAGKNLTRREFWDKFPADSKATPIEKTNDAKLWSVDSSKASEIAQVMIDNTLHKKISRISGSLNIVCDDYTIQNTSGLAKSEKSTYISGIINADSEEGISVSGIGQASSRTLDGFEPGKIGSDALQMCVNSINPATCEPQTTSVIFEPLAVGELLFFVFGPNFSLKTYSEKKSCFSEKIKTKIAIDDLNLTDDPHTPDSLGAKSFDDEGVPTKITPYIKDGIFGAVYSDTYNALKEKTTTSGNACRLGIPLGRSTDPIPVSAPHNLTLLPGNTSREDIIKDTKNGILVSRLWYTYPVNPIKGDFSCTARSGIWIIKNGQMQPAKPVRIIHNLPILLQNISAICNNTRTVLPWAAMLVTCPTIRCDGISITPI